MRITIGKNNAGAEEQVFAIEIVLTKRLKLSISLCKPITWDEYIEKLKSALNTNKQKKILQRS